MARGVRSNLKKHGITFEEATTVFGDPRAITIESEVRTEEIRFVTIGVSGTGTLIIVEVHTDRNDRIRIISARPASRAERQQYFG